MRKNGEGILFRLQEHKRNLDKGYWTEAVVFTTSNNSFGPTEISYLENRFYKLASEAKRYIVKNANAPTAGHITEEKESELEEFIGYARIVTGTLGHKLFEPLTPSATIKPSAEVVPPLSGGLLLHLRRRSKKSGQTIEARCLQTSEGFVVLKGSQIEPSEGQSIPPKIKSLRQQTDIDASGILQVDILFRSPWSAAAFVVGGYANGLTDWKTADGKTLKEVESSKQ